MFSFFRSKKSYDAKVWQALVDDGARTASGILLSPKTAMNCAPVLAALRIRCETLAQLPVNIFKRQRDGGREKATDHPLHRILHDAPNPWTGVTEFVSQMELDTLLHCEAFAFANRVGGRIVELIRLAPGTVTTEVDKATQEPRYVVQGEGEKRTVYEWREVLHIKSFAGVSPIKQCANAIGLCMAMEAHASRIFSRGARPSGVLTVPGNLKDDTFNRIRDSWQNGYEGNGSGKTAILENGVKFEPLTFNSVDLQFLELRNFQIAEIARALAVPPMLIADYGRATWSNSEQMAQSFLTFGILPRAKIWQGAIARLLTDKERAEYYPEFNVDELVKADIAARFEAYSKAISARVLNPNEVRAKENLPAYRGGEVYMNPNIEASAPKSETGKLKAVA